MSYNNISHTNDSFQLPTQIDSIEHALAQSRTLTPQTRNQLFHELDCANETLHALQEKAGAVADFSHLQALQNLNGLQERIISLYGRVDDRFTDSEVGKIQEEAETLDTHLKQPLEKGNLTRISKEVDNLKRHIHTLCDSHRLLREDRRKIAMAQACVRNADAVLQGKPYQATLFPMAALEFDPEADLAAVDLYELAELFYHHKTKAAQREFNQLPDWQKEIVFSHLKELGIPSADPSLDMTKTVQALIATAHEISSSDDGQLYLSLEEIDQTFLEARQ
jgi:hypothetical protein